MKKLGCRNETEVGQVWAEWCHRQRVCDQTVRLLRQSQDANYVGERINGAYSVGLNRFGLTILLMCNQPTGGSQPAHSVGAVLHSFHTTLFRTSRSC
jgi:hypothetical protein